jgi:hypothetical protein
MAVRAELRRFLTDLGRTPPRRSRRRSPPTLADLQHPDYPGVTGAERHRPDGSVITTCTMPLIIGWVRSRPDVAARAPNR